MLEEFNARVGSRVSGDEEWWNERGPHGHGALNEAGRELLSFLSINEATVCNFTNRLGNTPSPSSGTALIMPS